MNEVKSRIVGSLDIFCAGILLGVICMFVSRTVDNLLNTWVGLNQKRRDLELTKAIRAMQEEIDKRLRAPE